MKILYLTDQTYLHGGVEKVLSQKLNYFADTFGDEVILATFRQNGHPPKYEISPRVRQLDLNVNYQIEKSYFHPVNLRLLPKHIVKLKRLFNEVQPDVIVSCNFGPDLFFLPFVSQKIPVIKEFHASGHRPADAVLGIKDKIMLQLQKWVEPKYTAVQVLNPKETAFHRNRNRVVIPNPVDILTDAAALKAQKVLAAGRLAPVKNFEEMIEIWALIAADFPDWELHIYGDDYLGTRALLEMKIQDLNVSDSVKLMGSAGQMQQLMTQYSALLMTSHTECFSMVMLEAMSAGLPVVSYDSPTGPGSVITHGQNGFLVPLYDKNTFARCLRELFTQPELRQKTGAVAREEVKNYAPEPVMWCWRRLFLSLTYG